MSKSVLSQAQFMASRRKVDPNSDTRRPKFTANRGSKTMRVESGRLPPAPAKHPHRKKASKRVHRETKKI